MNNQDSKESAKWWQCRYGFAGFFVFSLLVFNSVLRAVLYLAFKSPGQHSLGELAQTFALGFYRDFFVALFLSIPLLVWLFLMPNRWIGKWWHRGIFIFGFF